MSQVTTSITRFEDLPDVLDAAQLAAYLHLGQNTVYELLRSERISSIRVGRKFIIPKKAVAQFLELPC